MIENSLLQVQEFACLPDSQGVQSSDYFSKRLKSNCSACKFRIPQSEFRICSLLTDNIDQFLRDKDHPFDLLALDQLLNPLALQCPGLDFFLSVRGRHSDTIPQLSVDLDDDQDLLFQDRFPIIIRPWRS